MSDSSEAAALHLVEALIEQLEAEGVLRPESVGEIYDRALARAQESSESDNGASSELRARLARLRRQ